MAASHGHFMAMNKNSVAAATLLYPFVYNIDHSSTFVNRKTSPHLNFGDVFLAIQLHKHQNLLFEFFRFSAGKMASITSQCSAIFPSSTRNKS